jgi:hypothetical protein
VVARRPSWRRGFWISSAARTLWCSAPPPTASRFCVGPTRARPPWPATRSDGAQGCWAGGVTIFYPGPPRRAQGPPPRRARGRGQAGECPWSPTTPALPGCPWRGGTWAPHSSPGRPAGRPRPFRGRPRAPRQMGHPFVRPAGPVPVLARPEKRAGGHARAGAL